MTNYIFLIAVIAVLLISVAFVTIHGVNLTNEQYDRLKKVVMQWAAIVTFLGVIVAVFKVPYGQETIEVVAAIGALLSHIVGESDKNYVEGASIGEGGGIDEIDDI